MKTLYQELERKLNAHLPLDWHLELRRRLLLLVMGIILAESCRPRRIAQDLSQHGASLAQETSIERQIQRIENDPRITAARNTRFISKNLSQQWKWHSSG